MTVRRKLWLAVLGIALLTVVAGLVDYPKGPNITWPIGAQGKLVREIKVQLGLDLQGGTSLTYQADLSRIPAGQETDALAGIRDVIERRVNAFGVSEPIVQTSKSGNDWRVLVELPGVTDINQAIKQIGETPTLEFKSEGPAQDLTDDQKKFIASLNDQTKTKAQGVLDSAKSGTDFAQLVKDNNGQTLTDVTKPVLDAAVAGPAFAGTVGEVYPDLITTTNGFAVIKIDSRTDDKVTLEQIDFQTIAEDPSVFGPNYQATGLTGKQLKSAAVQFDTTTHVPVVALTFNSEGTELFKDLTTNNVGKTIAIYLDGTAISTPVVNTAITDGQAIIQGNFTLDEAKTLAKRLNEGALPVPISLVNQRNIGPSLGVEALQRSVVAGLIALVCLGIFMVGYYRYPGFIAMVALGIYGLLLLAIFKLWPITLTLSGVAGFILSLGMAVDANVLIFERLKEELRSGKNLQKSIDDGFKRAWLSIRDSNISSLITCGILSWFGTSVIKGFALTLALGIILSLFSAITITRTLLKVFPLKRSWWYGVKQ